MENYNQQSVVGIKNSNTQLYLVVGLIVALIIGLIAVFQAIRLQNRASTIQESGGKCVESWGTCSLAGVAAPAFINDFVNSGGKLVVRRADNNAVVATSVNPAISVQFLAELNTRYTCSIENSDGTPFQNVCSPAENDSGSCSGTPTISLPSPTPSPTTPPVKCEDCVDGEFVCKEGATTNELKDMFSIPGDSGSSCPALSLNVVNYNPPGASACPLATPGPTTLDCDKHLVFIESDPGFNRQLTKAECLEVKDKTPQEFLMRLHTGLAGNGCRNYEIVAYEKLVTKDPNGNEIVDAGNPIRICDKCNLQIGCPSGCWANLPQSGGTTQLDVNKLIDIPGIKTNKEECPQKEFCSLSIANGSCSAAGTETVFNIRSKGNARLYLDDQFGGKEWVDVTGQVTYSHTYKYSGYYDVVLECENVESTLQHFYCAQRVTKMCGAGGTPPVSSPTPTPPACPALTVVLDLKCPGGQCPTVTPLQTP